MYNLVSFLPSSVELYCVLLCRPRVHLAQVPHARPHTKVHFHFGNVLVLTYYSDESKPVSVQTYDDRLHFSLSSVWHELKVKKSQLRHSQKKESILPSTFRAAAYSKRLYGLRNIPLLITNEILIFATRDRGIRENRIDRTNHFLNRLGFLYLRVSITGFCFFFFFSYSQLKTVDQL